MREDNIHLVEVVGIFAWLTADSTDGGKVDESSEFDCVGFGDDDWALASERQDRTENASKGLYTRSPCF